VPTKRPNCADTPPRSQAKPPAGASETAKQGALEPFRESAQGHLLTTDQGFRINDGQSSLKATPRGPSLLEDLILREKITHFDHERIPERVVHAGGATAHGYFKVYRSLSRYTKAAFLQDPARKTPVFVWFSTAAGFELHLAKPVEPAELARAASKLAGRTG
jgi:catalase